MDFIWFVAIFDFMGILKDFILLKYKKIYVNIHNKSFN